MITKALNIQRIFQIPGHTNDTRTPAEYTRLSYNQVLTKAGLDDLQMKIDTRTLRYAGHVARMGPDRNPNRLLFCEHSSSATSSHASAEYNTTVRKAAQRADMQGNWQSTAQHPAKWRDAIDTYRNGVIETRKRRHVPHPAHMLTRSESTSEDEEPATTANDYTVGWDD